MRGILLAALVLATAPLYADYTPFYLGLLTEVLVFGLFALAYDVLLGHAGVLSLGHSAFLGVATGWATRAGNVHFGEDVFFF